MTADAQVWDKANPGVDSSAADPFVLVVAVAWRDEKLPLVQRRCGSGGSQEGDGESERCLHFALWKRKSRRFL